MGKKEEVLKMLELGPCWLDEIEAEIGGLPMAGGRNLVIAKLADAGEITVKKFAGRVFVGRVKRGDR